MTVGSVANPGRRTGDRGSSALRRSLRDLAWTLLFVAVAIAGSSMERGSVGGRESEARSGDWTAAARAAQGVAADAH